jgi:hypothetical protein
MRIRTSEGRHIFLRVAYLQCINEACGWSVRAEFEMTHELSPSGMPNPQVHLPSACKELRKCAAQTRNEGSLGDLGLGKPIEAATKRR